MEAVSRVCQGVELFREIAGITHRDQHPRSHQLANRTVYLLRTSFRSLLGRLPESLLKVLFKQPAKGCNRLVGIRPGRFDHQPSALGRSQ